MNKLFFTCLLFPLVAFGQPIPPPATQAEVDAGANRYKYVTPFTLANTSVVGTNAGISAVTATNIANYHATNSALQASNALFASRQASNAYLTTIAAQYTNVVTINTASNITLSFSNLANNTKLIVTPGSFTVTPSILNSNLAAGSMFQGAKLYNKTNLAIEGSWGQTILDGSGALGEVMFISNCFNVTFKGLTFRGMTNHNINALPGYSEYLWAGVNLYASARIRFENCTFERHADHGLQDKGAEANSVGSSTIISTNMIEVINCYFTDIGGFRTNSGDGTIRGDGTAIVPTGWTMEGNVFQDCQRGIEPYDTADADGRLFYNCIMRNNKFYNMVEFAISPAGSTNGHNAQVIGNTLINDPSFSYHGTNWGSGGIPMVCQGFRLNGGRGWVVKDNYAKGAMYIGFSMISGATLDDFTLEGNTADFINRGDSLGYGFWIGNTVNSAANASSVRRLTMRGNKTYKTYDSGILVVAARDSVVDGNTVSTILRTNIGASSSAFQFGAASMGTSIITNLTIQNNVAINGNNDAAQPMDVAFGYYFAANLSNVKSINNHAYDFDIAAYTNLAGDNVRIENSIAADTNRVMRVRDLNGLLAEGSNITLTEDSAGVVTIAGGAGGSGGTNFPNVNLVVGNTNLTLSAGVRKSFVVYTNGSSGVDLDLAVPSSGYEVDITVTNYGGSAITMTFFTNGVGAVFYDLQEKTNNTSWSVSPGGATYSKFIYIPTFGNWVRAVHSAPSLVFAVDTADFYMSTGGVNNLTATLGVTNYTGSGLLVRRIAPTFSNVVTFASTPSTDYGTVKLMSGDNQEYTAFGHHGVGGHSNLFRFSVINPQPNQILRMDSVIISGTENQMVMTNSTVSIDGNGVVSNVTQIKFKATASPAITTSNLLINFNTNRYFLTGLTNAIFTNLVEESTSTLDSADTTIFVKNTTGVTMGLVWPAYGAQHGYFIRTNANNPVISTTSLAAGAVGVASITVMPDGTNMFLTFTTWP